MNFVDSRGLARCEFEPGDETEACMVSSPFTAQANLVLGVHYDISSPGTFIELMIVSRFTKQVIDGVRHLLSQQQRYFYTPIASTAEPIYVVLCAYPGVSTTTSFSSSVTITQSHVSLYRDG